jgi:hypothetical protein
MRDNLSLIWSSSFEATHRWLKMVEMTPPDIDTIVLEIFETCTVPDFSQFLSTLQTNAVLNGHTLNLMRFLRRLKKSIVYSSSPRRSGMSLAPLDLPSTSMENSNATSITLEDAVVLKDVEIPAEVACTMLITINTMNCRCQSK